MAAKSNPGIVFGCFDLQTVMNILKSLVGWIHYPREVNANNFTVWMKNGTETTGFCYVWHEAESLRGVT